MVFVNRLREFPWTTLHSNLSSPLMPSVTRSRLGVRTTQGVLDHLRERRVDCLCGPFDKPGFTHIISDTAKNLAASRLPPKDYVPVRKHENDILPFDATKFCPSFPDLQPFQCPGESTSRTPANKESLSSDESQSSREGFVVPDLYPFVDTTKCLIQDIRNKVVSE